MNSPDSGKKKVYYAHPISTYGTPVEQRDIDVLKCLGFEVVNPNTPDMDAAYRAHGMGVFKALVVSCDLLAFRAFPDGSIPAGVAQEIGIMQTENRPVIELPCGIVARTLNVEATRETLRDLGQR